MKIDRGYGKNRGPYGTNEGDMWLGVDSPVGQQLLEKDGVTLIHEMMHKEGRVQECLYVTKNEELIARATAGHERYMAAQASRN
jgi:hypothetical protein